MLRESEWDSRELALWWTKEVEMNKNERDEEMIDTTIKMQTSKD